VVSLELVKSVKVSATSRRGVRAPLRVTIPVDIVDALGLKPGDTLIVGVMNIRIDGSRKRAIVYYKP
jgi:bifunctional DNA-binding transcriptional regulator/antitoxin component of YhaV-PrlF toxin-antitoxin module